MDDGPGIGVDSSGNAYVTGVTTSTNFPTTVGAFQTTLSGTADTFVAKIVEAPSDLITDLIATVNSFNLRDRIDDSLVAKLEAAQDSLAANKITAACRT